MSQFMYPMIDNNCFVQKFTRTDVKGNGSFSLIVAVVAKISL